MKKSKKRNRKRVNRKFICIGCFIVLALFFVYFTYNNSTLSVNNNDGDNVLFDDNNNISTSNENNDQNDDTITTGNVIQDDDFLAKLGVMSLKDNRYKKVIENKDIYPEKLLEMLSSNGDMISYMYDYDTMEGHVYTDNIGKVQVGSYPLLLQYDKRWGYGIYGDRVLAINGCGPTALAMTVAGLTGRNDITPYTIAKYAYDNGYYTSEWGTKWDLMTVGSTIFGVVGQSIPITKTSIYNELSLGHPVICSMRPGDFTTVGHFILLTGIKDDKLVINDSNSRERSNKLWDYDVVLPQIKGAWSFKVA